MPAAEPIALQFRSIEIDEVMKLIGDFAAVEVCISSEIVGPVSVDVTPATAWPRAVERIAHRNGFEARTNERQVVLTLPDG